MIKFAIIVAVMLAGAVVSLLLPLFGGGLRRRRGDALDARVALYKSRLEELSRARQEGALTQEDFESTSTSLKRELLSAAESANNDKADAGGPAGANPKGSLLMPIVLGAGLSASVLIIYLAIGHPDALDPASLASPVAEGASLSPKDLNAMVAALRERLKNEPNNGNGWRRLAQTYAFLERHEDAAEAYGKAQSLLGDEPDLLVDFAEVESIRDKFRFNETSGARVEKALSIAPNHARALWFGAIYALQRGDGATAVARWKQLLAAHPATPEQTKIIQDLIAQTLATGSPSAGVSPTGKSSIIVNVDLDKSLAAKLSGAERIFVFARAVEGPPMPLAVAVSKVSQLPLQVTLHDGLAVMPTAPLSSATTVVVGARVALTGSATPTTGDLQGFSDPVAVKGTPSVNITINQIVP